MPGITIAQLRHIITTRQRERRVLMAALDENATQTAIAQTLLATTERAALVRVKSDAARYIGQEFADAVADQDFPEGLAQSVADDLNIAFG